jgi:NAD(P)-dependent dehydrogenase (short-subunit alcohol dehydrogenase family)
MNLNLQDKKIIVTGGAKGIGKGICIQLAQEGAIPLIIDRDEEATIALIEEMGKGDYVSIDLTHVDACKLAIETLAKKHGNIDGLVNNAGINDAVGLEKGNFDLFRQSLDKNLLHYYTITQSALPYLIKSKGSIVNISSKVAETGQGNTSGYAAANGARNALTREWAVELMKYSIRVNAVVVAECYTSMYETWINSLPNPTEVLNKIVQKIPLEKRMTTIEEIGNMVTFLLSERSSHTTGQLIHVDGGYVHLDRAIE